MAYSDLELSAEEGNPIELYEFRRGSEFWRYTTASNDVVKAAQTFYAEHIQRDEIRQVADISKGGISLVFPRSNEFAASFLGFATEEVTTVTVFRTHFDDVAEESITYWKGRVLQASASISEITISCESVFTSLKRPGLRARYERGCRHGLYSAGCTLSMSSFKLTAYVSGVDDNVLTIADAAGYADGTFTGGMLTSADGVHRLITSHVGSAIRINRAFEVSPGSTDVSLYPGCDKLKSTCITKFNNLENFGGFPYIPDVNPFGGRSVV